MYGLVYIANNAFRILYVYADMSIYFIDDNIKFNDDIISFLFVNEKAVTKKYYVIHHNSHH